MSVALGITVSSAVTIPYFSHAEVKAQDKSLSDIKSVIDVFTLDSSEFGATLYQINLATGRNIDESIAQAEAINKENSDGLNEVVLRDWKIYRSDWFESKMTDSELTFYNRLDEIAEHYISSNTADAQYVDAYSLYVINGAMYSDLGLTKQEAFDISEWFLYNNPQYYFLKPTFLSSSGAIYMGCYPAFVDANTRADVTNKLFVVVDKWVESVNDDEISTYQKELSAHELLCDYLVYVSGQYDQSLYSAVNEKRTVCAGYSEAFSLILNASGIDTIVALSDCHAWNVVQLDDGYYYGVDITWNDSIGDYYLYNASNDSMVKYDTSDDEHVSEDCFVDWTPELASSDYVATYYDITGKSDTEVDIIEPSGFSVIYSSSYLTVDWSDVVDADEYEVEIYSGNTLIGIKTVTDSDIRITGAPSNAVLTAKIRAVDALYGELYYSEWAEFSFNTDSSAPAPDDAVISDLNVPVGLTALSTSFNDFGFTWDAVSSATGYQIEVYSDSNYTSLLASLNTSNTYMNLSGVNPGETYYIRVRAFNDINRVRHSDWAYCHATVDDIAQPNIPSNFEVDAPYALTPTILNPTKVRFSWSNVVDADRYQLCVATDSSLNDVVIQTQTKNTYLSLSGITVGMTYYVGVRTVDVINGEAFYSDWTVVTVKTEYDSDDIPDVNDDIFVPSNFDYTVVNEKTVSLSWDSVSNAGKYDVKVWSDADKTNVLASTSVRRTSLKLSGLQKGVIYYVGVRVSTSDGSSEWAVLSVTL